MDSDKHEARHTDRDEQPDEPAPRKRTRNAERTQGALLDAAEALFAERGFDGARMDEIARQAGYNISLLFRYFENKEGLYNAVIGRVQRQENGALVETLVPLFLEEQAGLTHDLVRRFLEAWITWFLKLFTDHPHLVRLISWEMSTGWKAMARLSPPAEYKANTSALDFLERAKTAGLIRPTLSVRMIFATMFSLCMLLTLPRSRFQSIDTSDVVVSEALGVFLDLEQLRRQIIEQVLYGVFPQQGEVENHNA